MSLMLRQICPIRAPAKQPLAGRITLLLVFIGMTNSIICINTRRISCLAPRKTLDINQRVDTIMLTMIRRHPKPDPKQRALQESGTANPHAQDVQDPAFVDSDFFDPRDLIQVKYEMLRRVRTEGQSVAKATSLFGMSRPTFYKV